TSTGCFTQSGLESRHEIKTGDQPREQAQASFRIETGWGGRIQDPMEGNHYFGVTKCELLLPTRCCRLRCRLCLQMVAVVTWSKRRRVGPIQRSWSETRQTLSAESCRVGWFPKPAGPQFSDVKAALSKATSAEQIELASAPLYAKQSSPSGKLVQVRVCLRAFKPVCTSVYLYITSKSNSCACAYVCRRGRLHLQAPKRLMLDLIAPVLNLAHSQKWASLSIGHLKRWLRQFARLPFALASSPRDRRIYRPLTNPRRTHPLTDSPTKKLASRRKLTDEPTNRLKN
ncbi:unnamed protein product, partial [Protopolystoma xenopodis]